MASRSSLRNAGSENAVILMAIIANKAPRKVPTDNIPMPFGVTSNVTVSAKPGNSINPKNNA